MALADGDLLGLIGETIDIAKKYFPALKIPNILGDTYELGGKAADAYEAIKRLDKFGEEFIDKFFNAMHNVAGGILGKIKWKGGFHGALMPDVDAVELILELGEQLGAPVTGPTGNNDSYTIAIPDWLDDYIEHIQIYKKSNTTPDVYTLDIKANTFGVGSYHFKVRFKDIID